MNEMLAFAVLSQVQGRPGIGVPIGTAPVFSAQLAPAGTVGVPYSYQFIANGAPTYSLGSGSFPAGLSLDPVTGILSGTPTTATGYTFTVNATNGNGTTASTSQNVTIAAGAGGGMATYPPDAQDFVGASGSATFSWTAPTLLADGLTPVGTITNQRVRWGPNPGEQGIGGVSELAGRIASVAPGTLSKVIGSLTAGIAQYGTVTAVNSADESNPSNEIGTLPNPS